MLLYLPTSVTHYRLNQILTPLYFGACGVIWALHYLQSVEAVQLSKSYIEKGYKPTLNYSEIIDTRIREKEKLNSESNVQ